jgi:hypothetical protein
MNADTREWNRLHTQDHPAATLPIRVPCSIAATRRVEHGGRQLRDTMRMLDAARSSMAPADTDQMVIPHTPAATSTPFECPQAGRSHPLRWCQNCI